MLNRELFTSLAEAKLVASEYRDEYNHLRPHSALGYKTPTEFARTPCDNPITINVESLPANVEFGARWISPIHFISEHVIKHAQD